MQLGAINGGMMMNNIQELILRLRNVNGAEGNSGDPALLDKAAQALEEQNAEIAELREEKSNAFKAGMKAEAYLQTLPQEEDG